jgi:hypothetical protein
MAGGFTIFLFWPQHIPGARALAMTTEQMIKSLFGEGKLSNEAVTYYSKRELYIFHQQH